MNDKYLADYIDERVWLDELPPDERNVIVGTMDYMCYALYREWKNLVNELSIMGPFKWIVRK